MNTQARLLAWHGVDDERGRLHVAECGPGGGLPFSPTRVFFLSSVPEGVARGGHAHRTCEQLLCVPAGGVTVTVRTPAGIDRWRLDSLSHALYVPPWHWLDLTAFAPGTTVMVLASHDYDPGDYLRDLSAFLAGAAHA